jgi:hypothetical protein
MRSWTSDGRFCCVVLCRHIVFRVLIPNPAPAKSMYSLPSNQVYSRLDRRAAYETSLSSATAARCDCTISHILFLEDWCMHFMGSYHIPARLYYRETPVHWKREVERQALVRGRSEFNSVVGDSGSPARQPSAVSSYTASERSKVRAPLVMQVIV